MNRKQTLHRLLRLLAPAWPVLAASLVFAAAGVGLSLYSPVLIGRVIDCIVAPGRVDYAAVRPLLFQLALVAALTAAAQWLMALCNNRLTYRTVRQLRCTAFARIQQLPLSQIDRRSRGELLSRITSDVDQMADGLLLGFSQLFSGVATILGTLGFMLATNAAITAVVVLLTPLSFFVASFIARRTFAYFQQQAAARGRLTGLADELAGGEKEVQAFCGEARAAARFDEVNAALRSAAQKATFYSSLTNPCTRFVNGLVYAGVGIVGAFVALNGALTVGELSRFLSYANQYTKPFNEISGVITELQNALASAGRVFELIELEAETPDGPVQLPAPDGHVELDDVSFSYLPERPLIRHFTLDVQPGRRVAIVGPTGCGKTTLINLLMRFYDPTGGEIRVDGHPLPSLTRRSLRAGYGMVLQDTWLRSGTIRDNIAYADPSATDEEIVAAAKAAHAHSFIRRLPNGYDTVIGEEGGSLSAGQKQLLCIARVMLRLPPMLILDEATSSIDTRTEAHIQDAFAGMMAGRTSFVVAHRLSTIQSADVILMMENGQVIEQGTHEQLLAKNGAYARLYRSQFAPAE